MEKSIFQFQSYRLYLRALLEESPRRGTRSKLALHLNCQVSFLSQVLTERAHLTLEHALGVADFFQLAREERKYFMLMIQRDRAGSQGLREFFETQMKEFVKKHEAVREKIEVREELSENDFAKYYSSWLYSAVHIASAIPGMNDPREMATRLGVPLSSINEAVEFLARRQIIQKTNGRLSIGKKRVHLDSKSPFIVRHHSNWRQKVQSTYEQSGVRKNEHLHYTAVLGLSREDAAQIKNIILESIQKSERVLKSSKEETPFVLLMDWFELSAH